MKNLRLMLASTALAVLTLSGCFLVSGQFLVALDLDTPLNVTGTGSITGLAIDLAEEDIYNDHKDKIKDIADFALLGRVVNNVGTELSLEVYLVDGANATLSLSQIQSTGTKIWGPLTVPGNGEVTIDWNASANLFSTAGKAALLAQAKGDGQFTLYAVGAAPNFTFHDGKVIVVLAAGT
jgi:hypothetical protein